MSRALERQQRRESKERLRQIRAQLKQARALRVEHLKQAKSRCKAARREVKQRVKDWRAMQRVILQRATEGETARVRRQCSEEQDRIMREDGDLIASAEQALKLERKHLAELKRAAKPTSHRKRLGGLKAAERRLEDDDATLANIPDDLHDVFRAIKHKIKASNYRSRPEAFLEYVHDHPEVVIEVQNRELEKAIARLEEEERREAKSLGYKVPRKRKRRSIVDLSDVPF